MDAAGGLTPAIQRRSTTENNDENIGCGYSADLNDLALSWLQEVARWSAGDFSADGKVNSADLNGLALNWLQSIPSAASSENIPEPAASVLLLFGTLATPMFRLRRHN